MNDEDESDELTEMFDISMFAALRDPAFATAGYFFDFGGFGHFKWFDSIDQLSDHLLAVQIPIHCDCFEDEIRPLRVKLAPVLQAIQANGLTERARFRFNAVVSGLTLEWWGSPKDLMVGQDPFSVRIRSRFAALSGTLGFPHERSRGRIASSDQYRDLGHLGYQLFEQLQPLRCKVRDHAGDACGVPARARQARD
jgi:hypothetical protein